MNNAVRLLRNHANEQANLRYVNRPLVVALEQAADRLEALESPSEPACSAALIIEAGDYELQDDNPDVIWLYHSTGEGVAIPRDEFADYLDALFKQRF